MTKEFVAEAAAVVKRVQLSLTYARVLFGLIVLLFGFGVWYFHTHSLLALSFFDATLVALFVAGVVEPYLLNRFAHDVFGNTFWGLFDPGAPDEYKRALRDLAEMKHYYTSARWRVEFAWEVPNKVLRVTTEGRNSGIVEDPRGYTPSTPLWVLGSCGGYETVYEKWFIDVPGVSEWQDDCDFERMDLDAHLKQGGDGTVTLDEAELANGRSIPRSTKYSITRRTRMYRHSSGYLPLVSTRPTLDIEVRVTGDALGQLDVRIFHTPGQPKGVLTESRILRGEGTSLKVPYVTLPGQATVVTWRPVPPIEAPLSLPPLIPQPERQ